MKSNGSKSNELKSGIENELKTLESILQNRKNRSKKFNLNVECFIGALAALYREVMVNSPSDITITDKFLDQDVLQHLLIQTYYSLPNLRDSGPFFSILHWIKTLLVTFVDSLEKLNWYKESFLRHLNESWTKFLERSKEVSEKMKRSENEIDIETEAVEPWKYKIMSLQSEIQKLSTNVVELEGQVDEWKKNWIANVKDGKDDLDIVRMLKHQSRKCKLKRLENAFDDCIEELEEEKLRWEQQYAVWICCKLQAIPLPQSTN